MIELVCQGKSFSLLNRKYHVLVAEDVFNMLYAVEFSDRSFVVVLNAMHFYFNNNLQKLPNESFTVSVTNFCFIIFDSLFFFIFCF